MKRMTSMLLLLLVVTVFLCGCHKDSPVTTPSTTVPTTVAEKLLSEMTDYELLRNMAIDGACSKWAACSYHDFDNPLSVLMDFSPEFTELMTRPTAADSIRTHMASLEEMYPGSALSWLESYLPEIEDYVSQNAN